MSAGERDEQTQLMEAIGERQVRQDALMDCIMGGLKEYQTRYEELLRAHDKLKGDHQRLQETYNAERECWKRFRQWWIEQQGKQQSAKHTVSSPILASAQSFRATGLRSISGASSSRSDSTTILRSVGLVSDHSATSSDGAIETPSKMSKEPEILSIEPVAEGRLIRKHQTAAEKGSTSSSTTLDTSSEDKGNRHSRSPLQAKTLNAEYEIDPAKNGDMPFLHKSVVRNKAKRKQMHAFDCECCKDWYDAVGPVAVRPYEEIRSDDTSADHSTDQQRKRQEHLQRTSRHRDHGPPPLTPPGYWDIGFPDTQRVLQLNRTADETDRRRKEMIARDPRFRRRSDICKR